VAGGFHTIDFLDLYTNPITTSTLSKPGCPPYVNPRLSLPADLITVDQAWASCEPLFYGAFDPPRFLKKASGGLVPSAASQPTATAAGGAIVSAFPAVVQATPAPMTPALTATTNGSPSDPSPKAEPYAQNAGLSGIIQPSQALPADSNPPVNAQMQGNPGTSVVDLGGKGAPATPILAPGSPARSTPQKPQASGLDSKTVPDGQNVPQSIPDQATNPEYPIATQTQNEPISLLVDSGNGAANEGNSKVSTTLKDNAPVPALTQGMAKAQNDASPVLVDPGNGALLEANSNSSPSPDGKKSDPRPMPIFAYPGNGALVESSSSNGAATPVALVYAAPGLEISQQTAASHRIQMNGQPVDTGSPKEGAKADVSRPVKAGNVDVIGDSATVTGEPSATQTPTPLVIGGNTVRKASDGVLFVAGQTFVPGNQATVSGAVVSVGTNNVIVDGTTHAYSLKSSETPNPLLIGGNNAQRVSGGGLVVASQTITPGSQATISGVVVSVGASNVVVDGTLHVLTPTASELPSPLLIGGQTALKAPDGAFIVGSQTVTQGGQATISGHIISVGSSELVVDASTHSSPPNTVGSDSFGTPKPLSIAGYAVQKAPDGAFIVGSQTVTQGSQATISGHIISVGSSELVVDASTHSLSPNTVGSDSFETPKPLSIAGYAVQKAADGDLVIAGQTISRGSQATISGHIISVGPSELVVDASTHSLPPNTVGSKLFETPKPLSIAGYAVQKAADGGLVIAGQTISRGSQATISGVVVSAGSIDVVVDGKTRISLPQFGDTATPISIESVVYTTSNIAITLSSGATFQSGGSVMTYLGSSTSVLTEPTKAVIGITTVPYQTFGPDSATSEPTIGGLIASALGSGAAAPTKANSDLIPKQPGKANGPGPARGAGARKESNSILMNGIFALLEYIVVIGFLV